MGSFLESPLSERFEQNREHFRGIFDEPDTIQVRDKGYNTFELTMNLLISTGKQYDELFFDHSHNISIRNLVSDDTAFRIAILANKYAFKIWRYLHSFLNALELFDEESMILVCRAYTEAVQRMLYLYQKLDQINECDDSAERNKIASEILSASEGTRNRRRKEKKAQGTAGDGVVELAMKHETNLFEILGMYAEQRGIELQYPDQASKVYYSTLSNMLHIEEPLVLHLYQYFEQNEWHLRLTPEGRNARIRFSFGCLMHHSFISIAMYRQIEELIDKVFPNSILRSIC